MFKFIFCLGKLILFSFYVKKKYDYTKKYNIKNIKLIRKYINDCGCICTKCVQWLIPLLEKNNINKDILNIFNDVYENNEIHDIKYTKYLYEKQFKTNIYNDYKIIDVIGSGSIGQVYKVKDIKTNDYCVMKVKHPNIDKQMLLFKYIFAIIYKIKIFNRFFYKYFPFDLVLFLEDFYKQSDFINESNNILSFYNIYEDNDYVIIPKLLKVSDDIIIMEYVEGHCLDDLDLSEYKKSKIIYSLYLFVRNNLLIFNNNHGDLHKFNWKVSDEKKKNLHKIIIYDFGYCFKLNKEEHLNINRLCELIVSFDNTDKVSDKYSKFLNFLFGKDLKLNIEFDNRITEPDIILKQILTISSENNLIIHKFKILNSLLLMSLVDNYFQKYNINNNNTILKVKKNILDAYNFCNTYDIYPELAQHLLKEYNLNYKQKQIFESISFDDNIKSLI
jgi:predicted unusual protein kinase regulating ubiquinone biosynthesis (AarF/ABC1/UbiB family)